MTANNALCLVLAQIVLAGHKWKHRNGLRAQANEQLGRWKLLIS